MKLSKKLLQAMTVSLALGATVATTSSCSSLKEQAEITPENEVRVISCGINGEEDKSQTVDYCPLCGRG